MFMNINRHLLINYININIHQYIPLTFDDLPPPLIYKLRLLTYTNFLSLLHAHLLAVEMIQGQLVKALLKSKEVYILDCYTDIFVW